MNVGGKFMQSVKRIYWTDTGKPGISYFDVSNNSVHSCVNQGLGAPLGIAVDSLNGKIYWTDYGTHTVQRAELDGSNIEILVENLPMPRHIAIDSLNGKIYWLTWFNLRIWMVQRLKILLREFLALVLRLIFKGTRYIGRIVLN